MTGTASDAQTTVTVINSGVATSLFTVTTTDTASTQTLLFTESTTTTASTQTDITTTTTTTTVPTTDVSLAPAVTSTKTLYQVRQLKARSRPTDVPEVPKYASGACNANFAKYAKACACAGAKVVTVTAEPSVKTVTIEAGTVTSIYSTYSSTETSTDLATATTSTTLTSVISVTDTVTSTTTETASSTTVISETSTPTTIVTLICKPPGSVFHATVVQSNDGTTRYFNNPGGMTPAWQIGFMPTSNAESLTMVNSHSWVLNSYGYLEGFVPPAGGAEVAVPYLDLSVAAPATVQINAKPKSVVEAAVRAGTYARVSGCISAETNALTLSIEGRNNIFNCGNGLWMSSGDASDAHPGYNCVRLFPTAFARTLYL